MNNKIISFYKLQKIRKNNISKTIGLAHGVFDLLHYGHILHLKKAKEQCDILIVSITSSEFVNKGPNRPYYSNKKRLEIMSSLEIVDFVILSNEKTAKTILGTLKPNFYFKGDEYEDISKDYTKNIIKEINVLKKNKGKIIYTKEKTLSSSNIINKFFLQKTLEQSKFLEKLKKKLNFEKLKKITDKAKDTKVLIIGDAIIDRYIFCKTLGKSPKEDVLSVAETYEENYIGGIFATANHLSQFSNNVTLLTMIGDKGFNKNKIFSKLEKNIKNKIYIKKNFMTLEKTRYLHKDSNNKLFQKANYRDFKTTSKIENQIIKFLNLNIKKYDVVIVNDFGHGLISQKIKKIIQRKSKFLALNVQTNSANSGYNYVSLYNKANYITLDEPEARLSTQDNASESKKLFKKIFKNTKFKYCSITHGKNGTRISNLKNTVYVPVFSDQAIDTVGAGDAYFAITSIFMNHTKDMDIIGFVGNLAGAIQISYLGHQKFVKQNELLGFAKSLLV